MKKTSRAGARAAPKRFDAMFPRISPNDAIAKAGGRKELIGIFVAHGKPVSKQAVCKWVKSKRIPIIRIIQLAGWKPEWFGR